MKTQLFFFLFIILVFKITSQTTPYNDSILRNNADQYLITKFGQKFTDKYLKFLFVKGAGVSAVFYETKSKPRPDGKNTFIVYFKYQTNYVDSARYMFSKKKIINCTKIKRLSNLLIGIDKAKEIAEIAGLPKNEQPWTISAYNFGADQVPKWSITTHHNGDDRHGNTASIDMKTGTIEIGMWSSSH